jgi:hypothetical protein
VHVTRPLGNPEFHAISARPQGGGTATCVLKVDGVRLPTPAATGGFNIADGQIGQDPITSLREDDDTG